MANGEVSSIIAGPQSTRKLGYPMLTINTGQGKNWFFLPYFHFCVFCLPFLGAWLCFEDTKVVDSVEAHSNREKKKAVSKKLNGQTVQKQFAPSEFPRQIASPINIFQKVFGISLKNEAGLL